MMKSFKIKLVPNKRQWTRLFQFAGSARFAYNWALRKEIDAYESGENFINPNDLRKEFTLLRNSDEYSWLKTISNNVTKQAIRDLGIAYDRFFKGESKHPQFKSKKTWGFQLLSRSLQNSDNVDARQT